MSDKKDLELVVQSIVDALPLDDSKVICEALGRIAAVFLAQHPDMEFETWVKAVRDTRRYVITHGMLN